MSVQSFFLKQLIKTQMHKIPPEARDMVMKLVDENPELLMKLAQDLQAEKAAGKSDQDAFMAVAQKHGDTLKGLLGK